MNNNIGVTKKQVHEISFADLTNAEWAQISPDKVIVATESRTWLYQPRSADDRFTKPMKGAGSIPTTRKLLDGAIAAAKYTINSNFRPPALTSTRWIWRLAGAYHLCHPTLELMEEASVGFYMTGCWSLAEWAAQKANEEQGHDRLALRDIQSMGYDPEAVVKALIPPAAVALIDYFTRSVEDLDPIDCVGYSYTMERLALGVDKKYIQKVEDLLVPGINATRCLRVHSSVGADIEHTEETVEMVAGLTAKERTRIARACYETALMCFSPPSEGYISDKEIQQILEPLKITDMSAGKS
ncbi:iron-containing redox enzyme family protein [Pleurocapsales cyanobacterium LEGE 10410]|nr:iron-containing redox enzyme family protein [Pleurocapsales cyanobacterium LEGE 10410]